MYIKKNEWSADGNGAGQSFRGELKEDVNRPADMPREDQVQTMAQKIDFSDRAERRGLMERSKPHVDG